MKKIPPIRILPKITNTVLSLIDVEETFKGAVLWDFWRFPVLYWGDNLRRPNAIPKGVGERTDQSESAACPPHPLSHTIDMAFGDWSCQLFKSQVATS
jgi:hypothetical protein